MDLMERETGRSEGYCRDCGSALGIAGRCDYCAVKKHLEAQQNGWYLLLFAANDISGNFTGEAQEFEVMSPDLSETLVRIIEPFDRVSIVVKDKEMPPVVEIGGRVYDCRRGSYCEWVGNNQWNGVKVSLATARSVIRHLYWMGWSSDEETEGWSEMELRLLLLASVS